MRNHTTKTVNRRKHKARQCERRSRLRLEVLERRELLAGDLQFVSAADTTVAPGAQVSLPVVYQTLDSLGNPSSQLASGLGLRLHFASSKLTFDSLSLGVAEDVFFNPNTVEAQDDTSDFDNDPSTDKFITAVWNDLIQIDGGWPAGATQPVTLYTSTFTAAADFSGQTDVNFSASATGTNPSTGQSFAFQSESATITAEAASILNLAASDADKAEGNSGTTDFTFTVSRTGDTSGTAGVAYAVSGSGTNPADAADFGGSLPSGTVNFAAGETSRTITVPVSGNTDVEPDEGFTVTLSGVSGATLGTATADGMIRNDDGVADLGQVDFLLLKHLSLGDGSLYFRIETAHEGFLTLQVDAPKLSKSARLKLYDADPVGTTGLTPLAESALDEDGNQRTDWPTSAGTVY